MNQDQRLGHKSFGWQPLACSMISTVEELLTFEIHFVSGFVFI